MGTYSKSGTAKQLGISGDELKKRAKAAGYNSTEDYINASGGVAGILAKGLKDSIIKDITEIDRQLDSLFDIGLTQEEKDAFLQKAITEIQPYYDSKSKELQDSIREGKIRTAEDALATIKEVEQTTMQTLARYDLSTAQTEEEFITRLSDITATKGEDMALKAMTWRDRIETAKINQIQSGQFTSGVGAQKRQQLEQQKSLELGAVERKAQVAQTGLETEKKYTLDQIRLARESAQQARTRQIGAPVETEETKQSALGTLGYSDINQLPNQTELERLRTERGVSPIYNKTAVTDLERQRLADVESTNLELQKQHEAENTAIYEKQRQKLLADKAAKAAQLGTYAARY